MQERHSMHLSKPHLRTSHTRKKHCQHGLQVSLSPDLTTLLTHHPHLQFVVLLRKDRKPGHRHTLLLGSPISPRGPHSLPEAQVLLQTSQAPSPYHPNLSCSWSTGEITSRTSSSQAPSLRGARWARCL